jgi:hypothetical protein
VTDETNDPTLTSWCESAQGSDFPIQNLPLGIFSVGERRRRAGVAIGDYVLDLAGIADLLDEDWRDDLSQPVLNGWLARGLDVHDAGRYFTDHEAKNSRPFAPGMVLTVEPGIYIPADDKDAPAKYRGIGIRIEDDVVCTEADPINLTREGFAAAA